MRNPIIVDLGFGDGGKGATVDYLAMPGSLVVRYNGGPQAAHNVVTANGRHHTFAQFGSGTFVGAATHLSRFMLINPINMLTEERHLDYLGVRNAFGRTTVDPRAAVITPFHVAANRIKEVARREGRHGSCGQGVGEARAYQLRDDTDTLVTGDLQDEAITGYLLNTIRNDMISEVEGIMEWALTHNATAQREWQILNIADLDPVIDAYSKWARLVTFRDDDWIGQKDGNLIFEGAQGVLLDETHGFGPHNTWTDCTANNAITLCEEAGVQGTPIAVVRTYMTRHGAGPFPTEFTGNKMDIDRSVPKSLPEMHNGQGEFQGAWRIGRLDLPLLRYAIDCCDTEFVGLAVTHVDRVPNDGWYVCTNYRLDGHHLVNVDPFRVDKVAPMYEMWEECGDIHARMISEELGIPLVITSHGPTAQDRESYALI